MDLSTILVGVDFSEPSRAALGFGARLAADHGAALHVLFAEHALLAAVASEQGLDLEADARAELARFVDGALPPGAGLDPHLHLSSGAAATALVAAARDLDADLIVVGSHGMSAAARVVFGSTTQRVLRRADRSVLVVPAAWTPPAGAGAGLAGVGPVVAAIDFSDTSIAAAGIAARLAARLGTSLELVHAVPSPDVPGAWQAQADAAVLRRVDEARRELERVAGALPAAAEARIVVTDGAVPDVLAEAAARASGRLPWLVLGRASNPEAPAPGAVAWQTLLRADAPILLAVGQADLAK